MAVNNKEVFESSSSTQFKIVHVRHTWTINNYSLCCEEAGQYLISPKFSVGTKSEKSEWHLQLFPKGESKKSSKYVSLYLFLDKANLRGILATYRFGIVNDNGKNVQIVNETRRFIASGNSWGWSKFVEQNFLFNQQNRCLLDDKLTIFCEITAKISGSRSISEKVQSDLAIDFSFLFENKDFSDLILSVGEKEFFAHKVILTARSSVFRAMFQHDMDKNMNNRVEITDIDEESLCEMLRYMYTGKINKLEKLAPNLLRIAEKYGMNDLKIKCERTLLKNL